jgi:hypothetical protein
MSILSSVSIYQLGDHWTHFHELLCWRLLRKVCQQISDLVKIGQNFWAAYMKIYVCFVLLTGARGGAVVEALRYKPEGRGINSRLCHWNCSLT